MKILVVCDEGNNRSVTVAYLLKYTADNDVLTAGLERNSDETLHMLYDWADKIITTAKDQHIMPAYESKVDVWNIGEDHYRRPFNPQLLALCRRIAAEKAIA